MIVQAAFAIYVITMSALLVWCIELMANLASSVPLDRWRRLLIPLPVTALLLANLDGVLSFRAYLHSHPEAMPFRYPRNEAWNTDRFAIAGLIGALLLPFFLVAPSWKSIWFTAFAWAAHVIWLFLVLVPWLLATGVPLH